MADLLKQMPQLKEFYIIKEDADGSSLAVTPAQNLNPNPYCSKITTLSVSLGYVWPGTWINLLLPCLEIFKCQASPLVTFEQRHMTNFSELASVLSRSNCRLEKVTFSNIPAKSAKDFLDSHPSTPELNYSGEFGTIMYDEIFTLLTVPQRNDISAVATAPNLQTLSISTPFYRYTTAGHLPENISMALSRLPGEPSNRGEETPAIRGSHLKVLILGRKFQSLSQELRRRVPLILRVMGTVDQLP
ncbi:hypothetical protein GYMLUDRAFT_70794 [Collybiopsis luxurians FD-317 M1]|nr:hypothetical protein GYMLUDRAFT_70794 [Collybiopsis luxurians FD-317 M1]